MTNYVWTGSAFVSWKFITKDFHKMFYKVKGAEKDELRIDWFGSSSILSSAYCTLSERFQKDSLLFKLNALKDNCIK